MRRPNGKNLYLYKGKDRRGNTIEYEALITSNSKSKVHNTRAKFKVNNRNLGKKTSGGKGG